MQQRPEPHIAGHPAPTVTTHEDTIRGSHDRQMAGRTVVVTGGIGGIGKATALRLAQMGATVALTGRGRARTQDAADEIRTATGAQVHAFTADLSAQTQVRRLAAGALSTPCPASTCS
jgi:retinol dehydrogenase-14